MLTCAMARETHEREDLLRDARNLTPRAQIRIREGDRESPIFFGFRGDALSLYFDSDPVYQFNSAGELRRAFVDDLVIKAVEGRLVGMHRNRSATAVELRSAPLASDAEQTLLGNLAERLAALARELQAGRFELQGQVPVGADGVSKLRDWLASYPNPQPAISAAVS